MTFLRTRTVRFIIACLFGLVSTGCSVEARKARHLERGEQYFAAREFEKAKIEYLQVLQVDFRNALAIARLGNIWFEQGAPLRAYPYLFMARDLDPGNLTARTNLVAVLASLEEMAAAKQEASAILEQSPAVEGALMFLAGSAETEEEAEAVRKRLRRIPQGKDVLYYLASARLASRSGDTEYARNELEQARKLEPRSPRVHWAWASFQAAQKKRSEAEAEFEAAAELAGNDPTARFEYARFEKENGATEKARALLEEITKQTPDFLPAWRLLAQIAFERGENKEASALLERIFERDFANFEGRMLQADIWLAEGESKQALDWLERLDGAYQNVPLIKYQLARAYLRNNDRPQAIIALEQALAIEPDYVEAVLLLAELNLRAGDAPRVLGAMTKLLKSHPDLASAQRLLVEGLRLLGRWQDAAAVLEKQIAASPESADGYFRLGLILREAKQPNEARKMFEKALELAPGDLNTLDQLVELDLAEKNFPAAAQRVQEQLRETPSFAGGYFLQGKIYFSEKRWDQAEEAFLRAVELEPNLPGAYGWLVSIYVAANKVPQAIEKLQGILAKSPRDLRALTSLSLIYDQTKDYARARETYEKVLSIQPDPAMMNNLAYLYAEHLNQLDKAYEWARKARIREPVNPAVADTLGWISYKQAQYQRARDLLRESVTASGNNPEIQFHFGMASYMMDEVEEARAALKKAVAAPVDFPSRQEAARWLAYLEGGAATRKQWSPQELEALVQQRPKDPVARIRLGELYEAEGANEKAAAAYEAALNVNPRLIEPTLRLAQLFAGPLHKLDAALALAKAARDLAPDDPHTAGILGRIAYLTGNFDWAYGLLVESAHGRREDPAIAYDLAWAAYSLGKIPEAERNMRRVIELASDSEKSAGAKRFLALTNLEREGKDLAASQDEVEKALQADPAYVPALMIRAALEKQRGESKNAIATYGEILKRLPDFAPAQKQLAALYLQEPGALNEAYESALKARKNLLDDPELASILGEICYQRREFSYAIQLFRESARGKPLRGKDLYYLGMSQLRTSQNSEGKKTLEQALAAGLREPLSREAEAALSELGKGEGHK